MYKFTQVEDQTKFCLPLNRDTERLYYNTHLVLDANVLTEPRVWEISKINRTNSKGVVVYTCKQDLANQHTLKADYDENGNVIAWWADWNKHEIKPTPAFVPEDTPPSSITSRITCSGKPLFKIGGSAKTFTVTFYDDENQEIADHDVGSWSWSIDGVSVPNTLIEYVLNGNKIKIKFLGDDSYIGKILTITNTSGDVISSIDVEITAL